MKRRQFLAASGALGMLPLAGTQMAHADDQESRDYFELRTYQIESAEQRDQLIAFAGDAAIPALNRLGIQPVGVFLPMDEAEIGPVYVLIPHKSAESVVTLKQRLISDGQFLDTAGDLLDAPAESPAYTRVESSLLVAFTGMPHLETPVKSPGRVLQLRIYESPSEKTGQKKIEMFNDAGELAIFRDVGLHPVFFGEALVGSKLPNLTYMLAFESDEQRKANWKKFVSDPRWAALKKMDEYADKNILSNITNIMLKPAACSQI
jgi:hypothetical protein